MLQYIRSFGFIGSFCLCKQPITVKTSAHHLTIEALLGVLEIRDNWQNSFSDKG